jgi:phosphoglycolate phosphatase
MRHLIFDLDGTLIDSAQLIATLLNEVRDSRSLPPLEVQEYRKFVSLGAHQLIQKATDCASDEVSSYLKDFRRNYSGRRSSPDHLYPGVIQTINSLVMHGYRLAICSNKPEALCRKVLSDTGLAPFFEAVVGGDTEKVSKPNPQPLRAAARAIGAKKICFVGDSSVDQRTAQATEAQFLFFSAGYDDGVNQSCCDYVFSRMSDLAAWLLAPNAVVEAVER